MTISEPAERILPEYSMVTAEQMAEAIGMALGAASNSWESMEGTGTFDSERVVQILNELMVITTQFARAFGVIHNDQTMQKLYAALLNAGFHEQQIINAVFAMQNAGILFREVS